MAKKREAIVLAGGFGTRLAHIVNDVPKPMAPVASRPFLRFILDMLAERGFSRIIIADGYKRECIEDYFGQNYRGLEILYSSEESPLQTGGAIKKALALCNNDWVYVLNGDTYCEANFDRMEETALQRQGSLQVVLATKQMTDFDRYGTVAVDDEGVVLSFREKAYCTAGVINAGIYLLQRGVLKSFPDVFSFEHDFLEEVVNHDAIRAVECAGLFIDIGVPEDYMRAQELFAPLIKHWKLALFDRDGTLNVDTGHLFEPNKLKIIPEAIDLMKTYTENPEYKIVVVTNQAGIAKGYYTEADMRKLHAIMEDEIARVGGKIDAWYFCPHHPDFTGPCNCRKPKPGMILKALNDFDAFPEECIMFGDKQKDMEAAKRAGVQGVFVDWALL